MRSLLFVAILTGTILSFQFDYDRAIRHDQGIALKWKDFRGRPNKASKYAAKTSSGYNFNAMLVGDSMQVILPTLFHPRSSWVKKGKKSDYLLKHEQGHFDITEIFSRKMRRDLQANKYTIKSFKKQSDAILNKHAKAAKAFQKKYDHDTNHSIDSIQQALWNDKIETELNKLSDYSKPVFMLKVEL